MILSDTEIIAALENQQIFIDPRPTPDKITTSAVDLTLGDTFLKWDFDLGSGISFSVDPAAIDYPQLAAKYLKSMPIDEHGCVIVRKGEFVLATTAEYVRLPESSRLAARVEGRSRLARLGLAVHLTAPTIHSGFRGRITLEITNQSSLPILLRPGSSICQLIIEQVFGTPSSAMRGIFQDQESPTGRSGDGS